MFRFPLRTAEQAAVSRLSKAGWCMLNFCWKPLDLALETCALSVGQSSRKFFVW
jgi:hypothetical protein